MGKVQMWIILKLKMKKSSSWLVVSNKQLSYIQAKIRVKNHCPGGSGIESKKKFCEGSKRLLRVFLSPGVDLAAFRPISELSFFSYFCRGS